MEPVLTGGCQCGAVRYALYAMPERTSLCHCRMCQKAVGQPFAAYTCVPADKFAWTRGKPPTFRSSTAAERHFCPACGIYTHHRRRSNPNEYGVNAACLEGVSPFDFAEVPVYDGITHPNDRPKRPGYEIAGVLRYEPRTG